jgi:Ca-activated chloride channel family protein
MSFASPLVLLALVAVAAGLVAYVVVQRRRRRRAAQFANPALMASVAPVAPRWRRHVPIVFFVVALAALIVAAAKPERTVAVPDERASIMLVTDVSGSMTATDVAPNRLVAARSAAQRFLDGVPKRIKVGAMAFNQRPRTLQTPTRDRAAVREALSQLEPSGGTATGEAIKAALQVLRPPLKKGQKAAPAAIVLLSDGKSVSGRDPVEVAREAARAKVPIYTVALGTASGTIQVPRGGGRAGSVTQPVPPDPETLRQVSRISGGAAYTADDADQLQAVYQRLGSQLGKKQEKRQIGYLFVGGALAALALGAGVSLTFFGRVV